MSSRRRKRRSSSSSFSVKKKRSTIRTILETVMGISIGLLILGFVVWYYFIREEPEVISKSEAAANVVQDNVVAKKESYEIIRDGDNLEEQLRLLLNLSDWPREAATPVKLDTLGKRLEIAKVILDNPDLTEPDRVTAARAALQTIGQIYGICLDEGIETEGRILDEFRALTSTYEVDENPDVEKDARLGAAKLAVYQNTLEASTFQESTAFIEEEILKLVNAYPNDYLVLSTVRLLADRVKIEDSKIGTQLYEKILTEYESIKDIEPGILARLKGLEDEIALSQSDLGLLTKEVVRSEKFEVYFEKLSALIDMPNTGIDFANKIYEVVGFLESIGEHEKAIRVLQRIQQSVPTRTDRAAMIHSERMSRFGLIRNRAVGKPLDLNDIDSSGNAIDVSILKDRPCILAFYSPNNQLSETLLNDLNTTYSMVSNRGVKVITIAVEEATNNGLNLGFHPDWIKIVSIPPKGPEDKDDRLSQIFKRCPVSHVPYFAIVDTDGVLRQINVPTNQIKTRLETVISLARSSQQADDEGSN